MHGIEERRHEVTDKLVIQTIKSETDIDIDVKDIDWTHRISAKTENKRRPIIKRFVRYSRRRKVFNSKKWLKGKTLPITESLTKLWMSKLRLTRDKYGFRDVWTFDRKTSYNAVDTPDRNPGAYYQCFHIT